MFRFFRLIRQKLLGQNKFTKYLLYAIGEILLVVIGILMALQINNWNENGKSQTKEIQILKEIRAGNVADTFSVKYNRETSELTENAINEILASLESGEETDSLGLFFGLSMVKNNFKATIGPYEVLKSNGINLISNDSLRNAIVYLYESVIPEIEHYQHNAFMDDNYFREYCISIFNNISYAGNIRDAGFEYSSIEPHSFGELRKDRIYKTLLSTRLSQMQYLKEVIFGGIFSVAGYYELVIAEIDKELERLEK